MTVTKVSYDAGERDFFHSPFAGACPVVYPWYDFINHGTPMSARDDWTIRADDGVAENDVAVVRYGRSAEKAVRVFQIVPKIAVADEAWAASIAREAEVVIERHLESASRQA